MATTKVKTTSALKVDGDFDLKGYKAVNAADGTADDDLVTVRQLNAQGAGALIIKTTQSELTNTLIPNKQLKAGVLYEITGCDNDLYGGTTIWLKAISDSELEEEGTGLFLNPNYGLYPIAKDYNWWYYDTPFESGVTFPERMPNELYDVDDVVIWGGKYWKCILDVDATNIDFILTDFELNPTYFEEDTTANYIKAYDKIKYNVIYDKIIYRADYRGNEVGIVYVQEVLFQTIYPELGLLNYNPIKCFKWGKNNVLSNHIKNSVFMCINSEATIVNCNLSDMAFVVKTNLQNNVQLLELNLRNGFMLTHNIFIGGLIANWDMCGSLVIDASNRPAIMCSMKTLNCMLINWSSDGSEMLVSWLGSIFYSLKTIRNLSFSKSIGKLITGFLGTYTNGIIFSPIDKKILANGKIEGINDTTGIRFIANLTDIYI